MSGSKKVTVGYKYYFGCHMILCIGPVDTLTHIFVDNKTAWTGSSAGGSVTINAPNLFGGEAREGGVSGTVDVMMGGPTQTANSYLSSKISGLMPAFRGVVGIALRQVYIGLNPYLKRWAFRAVRIQTLTNGTPQWYSAKANISGDLNAAHIIRECLTSQEWGLGYNSADIDVSSFTTAADTLFTEGFGLSIKWSTSAKIDEFISEILRHIDATLFIDRATGLFRLKLIRNDYDVNTIPSLDENNVVKISDFKTTEPNELINTITVQYTDLAIRKENSTTIQDIALIAQQGFTNAEQIEYVGITKGALAAKVAARDLRALSTPLTTATLYVDRSVNDLNVGDVFKFSWIKYGVQNIVMRVTNIELGNIQDGQIRIQATQDVFGLSEAIYSEPPPSGWINPASPPVVAPFHYAFEAPYWELAQRYGDLNASAVDTLSGYTLISAVRPSNAINAVIFSDPNNTGSWVDSGTLDFCPTALLQASVGYGDTTWSIGSGIDLDQVRVGSYAVIDSEFFVVNSISDTTLTVGRGVLDTVPAPHANGVRIYFVDDFCESDQVEYVNNQTSRNRVCPTTSLGTLAVTSAVSQLVTINRRQTRPFVAQNIKINNVAYPTNVAGNVDLVITWSHRDRLLQTVNLIPTTSGNVGPETGVTYSLWIRTLAGTQIATITGLTGTTHTFTQAQLGANYGVLRLQVQAIRDGITSWQMHDIQFTRDPI